MNTFTNAIIKNNKNINEAKEQLRNREFNGGFEIIYKRGTHAIGFNPNNPITPYVCWIICPRGGYGTGHYFSDLSGAVRDLEEREI